MNRPLSTEVKPGLAVHPLGSWVVRVASTRPNRSRSVALIVLVGCVAILAVATTVSPERSGLGTHQQFGLAPCSLVSLFGYPCPTCGMTTAFANTVRGRVLAAFHAQPAGLVLALCTMIAAGMSLVVLFTGKVWAVNWYRVPPMGVAIALVLLVLGGWIFKIVVGVVAGTLPIG